jgi:hypothetical protein
VYVVFAATLTFAEPSTATTPTPLSIDTFVAFVVLQLRVAVPAPFIEEGVAVNASQIGAGVAGGGVTGGGTTGGGVTGGGTTGGGVTGTTGPGITVICCTHEVVPPGPDTVNVYTVVALGVSD